MSAIASATCTGDEPSGTKCGANVKYQDIFSDYPIITTVVACKAFILANGNGRGTRRKQTIKGCFLLGVLGRLIVSIVNSISSMKLEK